MKFRTILAALCVTLSPLVSCVKIDNSLGSNFIPSDQIWNVFPCEAVSLNEITMEKSDSLSGYSTSRFTFGSVKDDNFTSDKSTSFTLVPLQNSIDFGKDTKVLQFHFTAVRDTLSTLYDNQEKMLQNVYVHPLKQPLDSTVLYTGTFSNSLMLDKFIDLSKTVTAGIPVYDGGDSLSFDFSEEYAWEVINGIKEWQAIEGARRDSISSYLEKVPGIYFRTASQTEKGGRINMFDLPLETSDGYIDGNYAELKIRAKYNDSQDWTDTLFVFYFGPSEFIKEGATSYPAQYAFNASSNTSREGFMEEWESGAKDKLHIEGGSGYKPVVKAREIKNIVEALVEEKAKIHGFNKNEVVINKATIVLPYNVGTEYDKLDRYPMILSPTVKLVSDNKKYISYAGLTDSSIESENQGDINLSRCMYCPDVSHHVQEILKLTQGEGEKVDPNETAEQFEERLERYDIWFLIMHEEVTSSGSTDSAYDDYYNNLLYNSYYQNMMYDPYGYGYGGYGYGGYGYGGYGGYGDYGYNNYYNYYMMAAYANASNSSSSATSSIELDKDRFYDAVINGPGATSDKPSIKITFSAPNRSEE